jgi:hypothetical protein
LILRSGLFDRNTLGSKKTVAGNIQRLDIEATLFQIDPDLSTVADRKHRAAESMSEVERDRAARKRKTRFPSGVGLKSQVARRDATIATQKMSHQTVREYISALIPLVNEAPSALLFRL